MSRMRLIYSDADPAAVHAMLNFDHMPDHTPIWPLGARMVCSRRGYRGADVRPDWGPHVNFRNTTVSSRRRRHWHAAFPATVASR